MNEERFKKAYMQLLSSFQIHGQHNELKDGERMHIMMCNTRRHFQQFQTLTLFLRRTSSALILHISTKIIRRTNLLFVLSKELSKGSNYKLIFFYTRRLNSRPRWSFCTNFDLMRRLYKTFCD